MIQASKPKLRGFFADRNRILISVHFSKRLQSMTLATLREFARFDGQLLMAEVPS